ncbi:MAG TPA: decarboxylating 6-phosphogluconate dehydrogenase [Novimethylophilus sp.]|uniref:phosphogluconate dehydrogenase (NAD(+)-dependent, decarboxylating) n=1 Tax=Novimethylophilus sp. TaxID=2137426 RepID=UPI002F3E7272
MQIGMIGLGKMGANMALRLLRGGHQCVVYDRNPEQVAALVEAGATGAVDLHDFAQKLTPPRAAWVMVPAGDITEQAVSGIVAHFKAGDTIIDGGNSYYKDDVRRARLLRAKGILYIDAGTSGGVWGLERGYCLMVGGEKVAVDRLEPIFRTLAPGGIGVAPTVGRTPGSTAEQGHLYCGPSGAGHFVKMIHNGIEYGLMQAYAEGLDILRNANSPMLPEDHRYDFNLADIAELWRRGSVVSSWLLDLTAAALTECPDLSNFTGYVQDSGEGRWTVQAAIDENVPADVLTASLYTRFRSRQKHTFAERVLSAMRHQFGGHVETTHP